MKKIKTLFAYSVIVTSFTFLSLASGSNSNKCLVCNGKGRTDCALCVNGRDNQGDYCTYCNGRGDNTCTFCNGTGKSQN